MMKKFDEKKFKNTVQTIYKPELRAILNGIPRELTDDKVVYEVMENIVKENRVPSGTLLVSLLMLASVIIDNGNLADKISKEKTNTNNYIW